jgi:hypothetical protein
VQTGCGGPALPRRLRRHRRRCTREQRGRAEHLPPRLERRGQPRRPGPLHPLRRQAAPNSRRRAQGVRRHRWVARRTARRSPALPLRPGLDLCDDTATYHSPAEAAVVRRLHDGALDAQSHRMEPAIAHEWGSELEWTLFISATPDQTPASVGFAESYLRYPPSPTRRTPPTSCGICSSPSTRSGGPVQSSSYLSAMDPDLSAFRRVGGNCCCGTADATSTSRRSPPSPTGTRYATPDGHLATAPRQGNHRRWPSRSRAPTCLRGIAAAGSAPTSGRHRPVAVLRTADQRSDTCPGIEAEQTQPVERVVEADQSHRLGVSDHRVVLDR